MSAQRHQLLIIHLAGLKFTHIIGILIYDITHLKRPHQRRVFLVIKVLGIPTPGAIMILVQHYAIPVNCLNPFICSLNASYRILTQNILERCKTDKRLALVHIVKLTVILFLAELPTLKILMGSQILLPGGLDRRLESKHQNLGPPHTQRQLICGECLAKTHLGVPEEMRNQSLVCRVFYKSLKVCRCLTDRLLLLRTHTE